MDEVHIYTDGSSRGNPGPGGYGIVMIAVGKGFKKEFSQGYRKTTNNRMELLAVIEALEKISKFNENMINKEKQLSQALQNILQSDSKIK
jgi:ribonuclease HI